MKLLSILTVLSFLALPALSQKTIEKSFSEVTDIELSTSSGDIYLEKGSSDVVEVRVEHTYDEGDVEFIFNQRGSRLEMEEDFKSRSSSGSSKWYLKVPDNLEFELNAASGDVTAGNLDLELELNVASGDFSGEKLKGEVEVNVASGDIEITDSQIDIEANSASGDIQIDRHNGDIEANTASGDISVGSSVGSFDINAASGDLEISGIEITGRSGFNAASGDVEIVLSSELNHDISVNSSSGNAVLDFNGNKIEGSVIMEANKRNGEIVAPFEFDSTEEIKEGSNTTIRKTTKLGSKDIKIEVSTGSGKAQIKE